jgi:hypothetical protein
MIDTLYGEAETFEHTNIAWAIVYSVRLYAACETAAGAVDPDRHLTQPYSVPVDVMHVNCSQLTAGCARWTTAKITAANTTTNRFRAVRFAILLKDHIRNANR